MVTGSTVLVGAYALTVRGALTLDVGIGRRLRPLGPLQATIAATPETVFDVIAGPYLRKTPRAMADKLRVLDRGSDMVLAAHSTPTRFGLTAVTVETVVFERPNVISFRLIRGPVPHVLETFSLTPTERGTDFVYRGELGTDFWAVGAAWGDRVAQSWERAVRESVDKIKAEAERRSR